MSELTPYICVADSRAAIDWYGEHLGAQLTVEPIVMDDGRAVGRLAVFHDPFGHRWFLNQPLPRARLRRRVGPAPARWGLRPAGPPRGRGARGSRRRPAAPGR